MFKDKVFKSPFIKEQNMPFKRALLSVSDKTGLEELGRALTGSNIEILSTGGTARFLKEKAVPVTDVADYT